MQTWQRQTKDFGHTEGDKYSCLVFDNRGIGESDKPLLRYTTSEMAKDVVELLNHVGWTEERSVHVVGISMGGMIAQELVPMFRVYRMPYHSDSISGPPDPNTHVQSELHLHRPTHRPDASVYGEHA